MSYLVTFYALGLGADEVPITVHRINRYVLRSYTDAPGVALAVARSVKGEPKADGFRIVDDEGHLMLDYVDRIG